MPLQAGKPRAPGAGRKPGVPNKATAEIKALAQKHGPEALKELVRLAKNGKMEATRVSAIRELLDRAYGKSPQAIIGGDDDSEPIKHLVSWLNAGQ